MAGKSNGKFPAGYSNGKVSNHGGIRLVDLGPAWGWGSAETRLVVFIKVLLDLLGNGGACPTWDVAWWVHHVHLAEEIYGMIGKANKNDLRTEAEFRSLQNGCFFPSILFFSYCFPSPVDKRTRSNKHCSIDSELWNQVKLPWHFVPSHVPFPNVNLIWYCLKAVPTKTTSQSVSCICPVSNMNPLNTLRPVFFYVHSISVNQMAVITHYIIYIYI